MRSRSHSEPETKLLNPQMKRGRRGPCLDEVHRVAPVSVTHCLGVFDREGKRAGTKDLWWEVSWGVHQVKSVLYNETCWLEGGKALKDPALTTSLRSFNNRGEATLPHSECSITRFCSFHISDSFREIFFFSCELVDSLRKKRKWTEVWEQGRMYS